MHRSLSTLIMLFLATTGFAQNYQDVTALSGISHTFLDDDGTFGGGTSFMDFNGDGWDDISFASHLGDSLYFFQNNNGVFSRVYFSGLETTCQTKQIMWVDIDNDGDQDFFAACHPQANHFFENTGNMTFQDITLQSGLDDMAEYTFGCSFGDIDNDGDLDLAFFNRALVDDRNIVLYENLGNRTFTEITQSAGVENIPVGPFCGTFMDYNTDGWLDLYIAEDKYFGNVLFENDHDNTFTDVSEATGLGHALDAMCIAPGDYDNDGDIDIFVANTPLEGNHLFTNNGDGTYDDTAPAAGVVVNGFDWGGNFFDVENDGDLDLYISGIYTIGQTANSHLYINDGSGNFSVSSPIMPNDAYQSYSNAIGDFNRDGFPDIAVNNYDGTPSKLWKNLNGDNKTGGTWIKIKLQGVQSNINGYGTKLEVYDNGQKQLRYTYCGEGFIAQNAAHEIFGMGGATLIDSIVVTWLSGVVDVLYNVTVNQEILVVEGAVPTGIAGYQSLLAEFQSDGTGLIHFALARDAGTPIAAEVHMADGRLILHKTITGSFPGLQHELDLRAFPPGAYILTVVQEGRSHTELVVRN